MKAPTFCVFAAYILIGTLQSSYLLDGNIVDLIPIEKNIFIAMFPAFKIEYLFFQLPKSMAKNNIRQLYSILLALFTIFIIGASACCRKKIPCTGKAPCRRGPYRY